MATKKSGGAAKKTTSRAASAKKTTTKVTTVPAVASKSKTSSESLFGGNLVNIILAEVVGTFVLTLVALATAADVVPLFVGLTLGVLVFAIGSVSGAHVNPAVTFGLWAARRLKSLLVPFYWVSQFVGAMAAVLVTGWVAGKPFGLDFGHFTELNWSLVGVELVGTAVFLFGVTSIAERKDLSVNGKALGIGLSLFVGLVVSSSVYNSVRTQAIADYQKQASSATKGGGTPKIPHVIYAKGATLNPAVALAATEATDAELTSGNAGAGTDTRFSRLGLEVIIGTLIGAALGSNLALLVAYRFKS